MGKNKGKSKDRVNHSQELEPTLQGQASSSQTVSITDLSPIDLSSVKTPEAIFYQAENLFISGEQKHACELITRHTERDTLMVYDALLLAFVSFSSSEDVLRAAARITKDSLINWYKDLQSEQQTNSIYIFAYGVFICSLCLRKENVATDLNPFIAHFKQLKNQSAQCWRVEYITAFLLLATLSRKHSVPIARETVSFFQRANQQIMKEAYVCLHFVIKEKPYPPAYLLLGEIYADTTWRRWLNYAVKHKQDNHLSVNATIIQYWSTAISRGVLPRKGLLRQVFQTFSPTDICDLFEKIQPWDKYGMVLAPFIIELETKLQFKMNKQGKIYAEDIDMHERYKSFLQQYAKKKLTSIYARTQLNRLNDITKSTVVTLTDVIELKQLFECSSHQNKLFAGYLILDQLLPQMALKVDCISFEGSAIALVHACLEYLDNIALSKLAAHKNHAVFLTKYALKIKEKMPERLTFKLEKNQYYKRFLSKASEIGFGEATYLLMCFYIEHYQVHQAESLFLRAKKQTFHLIASFYDAIAPFSDFKDYVTSFSGSSQIVNINSPEEIICQLYKPQRHTASLQLAAKEISSQCTKYRLYPTQDASDILFLLLEAYFYYHSPMQLVDNYCESDLVYAINIGMMINQPLAYYLLADLLDKVVMLASEKMMVFTIQISLSNKSSHLTQDITNNLAFLFAMRILMERANPYDLVTNKTLQLGNIDSQLKTAVILLVNTLQSQFARLKQTATVQKIVDTMPRIREQIDKKNKQVILDKIYHFAIQQGHILLTFRCFTEGKYAAYKDTVIEPVKEACIETTLLSETIGLLSFFGLFERTLYLAVCLGATEALTHFSRAEDEKITDEIPVNLIAEDIFALKQIFKNIKSEQININVKAYLKGGQLFETCDVTRLDELLYILYAMKDIEHSDFVFDIQTTSVTRQKETYQITIMPNLRKIYSDYLYQSINKKSSAIAEKTHVTSIDKKQLHKRNVATVLKLNTALSIMFNSDGFFTLTDQKKFALTFNIIKITGIHKSNVNTLIRSQYGRYFKIHSPHLIVEIDEFISCSKKTNKFINHIHNMTDKEDSKTTLPDVKIEKKSSDVASGLEKFAAILNNRYLYHIKGNSIKCEIDLTCYRLTLQCNQNNPYLLFGKVASSSMILSFLHKQINLLRKQGCQIQGELKVSQPDTLHLTLSADEFKQWKSCQWPTTMPGVQATWAMFYKQHDKANLAMEYEKQQQMKKLEKERQSALWQQKKQEKTSQAKESHRLAIGKAKEAKDVKALATSVSHTNNQYQSTQHLKQDILFVAEAYYRTAQIYWQKLTADSDKSQLATAISAEKIQNDCQAIQIIFIYLMLCVNQLKKTYQNCKARLNFLSLFGELEIDKISREIAKIRAATKSISLLANMAETTFANCIKMLVTQFVLPDYHIIFSKQDYRPIKPIQLSELSKLICIEHFNSNQPHQEYIVSPEELPIILQVIINTLNSINETTDYQKIVLGQEGDSMLLSEVAGKIAQVLHCYRLIKNQQSIKQEISKELQLYLNTCYKTIRNIHFHENVYTHTASADSQKIVLLADVNQFLKKTPELVLVFREILLSMTKEPDSYFDSTYGLFGNHDTSHIASASSSSAASSTFSVQFN